MKWKRISVVQIIRHIVQIAAFIAFPQLFITVLGAMGDLVSSIVQGDFSLETMSSQLITVAAVLLITAVWGRFFCGFLCSFGTLQELFFLVTKKAFPRRPTLSPRVDRVLKYLKYVVFLYIAVAVWVMAVPADASVSPWGVFGMLISGNPSVIAAATTTVGFVLLLVIFAASFFVERFFCRYLCPLGAVFTLISPKRCYQIRRNDSTCTKCGLCERKCCMGIAVAAKEKVTSGECIDCMQCVDVCGRESLTVNPAPALAGTTAAVAMCGLIQIGKLTVPVTTAHAAEYTTQASETSETMGAYQDGVYTGSATGFRGDTTVQVTVENGFISDITVLSYEDDMEFFRKAQASVVSQILSQQTLDVANVSGATFSANGLIQAVANALGVQSQTQPDAAVSSETAPSVTNPATSNETGTEQPQPSASSDAQSADTAQGSSQTLDLTAIADGTYQGEGNGFRGATSVSVTVQNGAITDITIESYQDDEQFFTRAESTIISEILSAQSLDVQTVSGATFSSNGIIEAVANALNVTFENPNATAPAHGGHGDRGGERGDFPSRDFEGSGEFSKRRH